MLINKVSYTDKIWFLSHTKSLPKSDSTICHLWWYFTYMRKIRKFYPLNIEKIPKNCIFGPFLAQICPKRFFKSWFGQFELFVVWPLCEKNQRKQMSQCRERLMVWFWSWHFGDFGTCHYFSHNFCSPWRKNWLYPSFESW